MNIKYSRSSLKIALTSLVIFATLAASTATLHAQTPDAWPSKTITYIVPFTPGGSADVIGRTLSQKLTDVLKQSVIVENKPGAVAN